MDWNREAERDEISPRAAFWWECQRITIDFVPRKPGFCRSRVAGTVIRKKERSVTGVGKTQHEQVRQPLPYDAGPSQKWSALVMARRSVLPPFAGQPNVKEGLAPKAELACHANGC